MEKTNVMRILDQAGIRYEPHFYDGGITNGEEIARILGEDPDMCFKTLVTVSDRGEYYVFMIPVRESLDLKKAAKSAGVKKIEMIKQKELLPLTGYIHGGCSPIGMKKPFPTFIDETAQLFDGIFFSAGKVGCQVEAAAEELKNFIRASYADLT